jgi:signal transduction histidine kinase
VGARADVGAGALNASDERERLALLVHEVRSPTAALTAIAAALTEEGLDEETTRALLGLAVAASRGIDRIVGDGALGPLHAEKVDIGAVAQAAVASAALRGARIRLVVQSDLPAVRGDAVRLRQALDNMVANAVAHAGAGEEVLVVATVREPEVVISVSDRGPGIAAADQERIFLPGVRLDDDRPGSGIGLAVARAVAEAHDGTLTVDSAPGEGATFVLALPRGS